jgi:hypothetical protein
MSNPQPEEATPPPSTEDATPADATPQDVNETAPEEGTETQPQ